MDNAGRILRHSIEKNQDFPVENISRNLDAKFSANESEEGYRKISVTLDNMCIFMHRRWLEISILKFLLIQS
jgi:hypothetical protein